MVVKPEDLNYLLDKFDVFFSGDTTILAEVDFTNNDEVPSGIVIGLVEVGCGVLLLLTPFKKVGSGLIVDGSRRIFNDLESIDKSRHSYLKNAPQLQ